MTIKMPSTLLPACLGVMILIVSSCSSSRFYKGFEYRGSPSAPDMSGQIVADPKTTNEALLEEPGSVTPSNNENSYLPADAPANPASAASLNDEFQDQPENLKLVATVTLDEARKLSKAEAGNPHTSLAKNVVSKLEASGQISSLTAKQEKKLLKATSRMDKKMKKQGQEIDWKNNSGLELFFMIMAIIGLVLGIVSVGFGWFIFIVFAGLWLYWKLVKD
jgi:hypothetical protein